MDRNDDRMISAAERRFWAPEVVQTSAMDCGPAALKCLLEGFGLPVDYGRLREACQTDVDGTSINTIEDVGRHMGLQAQQVLAPADHLLLPQADLLPALVVTVQPTGVTHFVIVWRTVGSWVQVMDPAHGRRWLTRRQFMQEVYRHTAAVAASDWRAWAATEGFCAPLRARLQDLAISGAQTDALLFAAMSDQNWRSLAALDAAVRLVAAVVTAGGVTRGSQAGQLVEQLFRQVLEAGATAFDLIPVPYWSVQPATSEPHRAVPSPAPAEEHVLLLRGAVAVTISGRKSLVLGAAPAETGRQVSPAAGKTSENGSDAAALPVDLAAALAPQVSAWQATWRALRSDGVLTPALLVPAVAVSALTLTLETALLRALIAVNELAAEPAQSLAMTIGIFLFCSVLFLLDASIATLVRRLGRRIETRLRMALLLKIPRIGDRHLRSRLVSDMAHRAYSLRVLQGVSGLAFNLLRQACQLLFTAAGIVWIYPASWPVAVATLGIVVGLAIASQTLLGQRDLRVRTHTGALSRFYLDALLGLAPIRAHSAERALRREHEMLVVSWVRATRDLVNIETVLQAAVAFAGIGGACWIVLSYLARGGEASAVLLLLYWALNLPALGSDLVSSIQQYPTLRNQLNRLLEPLNAPAEDGLPVHAAGAPGTGADPANPIHSTKIAAAVAVELQTVTVVAAGRTILAGLNLSIAPGEHVAIVGASGAGKSTLVGLLLGWHKPAAGQLLVDGAPLAGAHVQALRKRTAWVDPSVQLWNRTLAQNLRYGMPPQDQSSLSAALALADLYPVLTALPHGITTALGEGGGLVSGGEGQRVRFGRALLRPGVSLAILDEPFRGLDRRQRHQLLANARRHWQSATLLCVTHDVAETTDFGRVLVLEEGRIVEDGTPEALAAAPESRYSALLAADAAARSQIWDQPGWRRLQLDAGQLLDL